MIKLTIDGQRVEATKSVSSFRKVQRFCDFSSKTLVPDKFRALHFP